jgi:hypothetical protein
MESLQYGTINEEQQVNNNILNNKYIKTCKTLQSIIIILVIILFAINSYFMIKLNQNSNDINEALFKIKLLQSSLLNTSSEFSILMSNYSNISQTILKLNETMTVFEDLSSEFMKDINSINESTMLNTKDTLGVSHDIKVLKLNLLNISSECSMLKNDYNYMKNQIDNVNQTILKIDETIIELENLNLEFTKDIRSINESTMVSTNNEKIQINNLSQTILMLNETVVAFVSLSLTSMKDLNLINISTTLNTKEILKASLDIKMLQLNLLNTSSEYFILMGDNNYMKNQICNINQTLLILDKTIVEIENLNLDFIKDINSINESNIANTKENHELVKLVDNDIKLSNIKVDNLTNVLSINCLSLTLNAPYCLHLSPGDYISSDGFTISSWINLTSFNDYPWSLLTRLSQETQLIFAIFQNFQGFTGFMMGFRNGAQYAVPFQIKLNTLYHVVAIYNGGSRTSQNSFQYYINNNLVQNNYNWGTIGNEPVNDNAIGCDTNGNDYAFLSGVVEDFMVFNAILNIYEVNLLYNKHYKYRNINCYD